MKTLLRALSILIITSLFLSHVNAADVNVESSGSMSLMQTIDVKKKIIYMSGSSIAYDHSTVIYDRSGHVTDASSLEPGLVISFDYDESRRYMSRPVATKIWIKSSHPMKTK